MLTPEQMIALHGVAFAADFSGPRAKAPTPTSISRINKSLGIVLPQSFVEYAERCPSYGFLLASIGDDFENDYHILNINKEFHTDEPRRVPPWFVVFNHGHDEDCDGFDSRHRNGNGEYPILYWDASQGLDFTPGRVFAGFDDYLEDIIIYYATVRDKAYAERIIHCT